MMKGWSAGLLSSVGAWTRHLGGSGICVSQEVQWQPLPISGKAVATVKTASTHRLMSPGEQPLLAGNHSSEAELQMAGQPLCHPCPPPASTTRPHGCQTTVITESPAFVREAKAVCAALRPAPLLYGCVPVNTSIFLLIYFLIGV